MIIGIISIVVTAVVLRALYKWLDSKDELGGTTPWGTLF